MLIVVSIYDSLVISMMSYIHCPIMLFVEGFTPRAFTSFFGVGLFLVRCFVTTLTNKEIVGIRICSRRFCYCMRHNIFTFLFILVSPLSVFLSVSI